MTKGEATVKGLLKSVCFADSSLLIWSTVGMDIVLVARAVGIHAHEHNHCELSWNWSPKLLSIRSWTWKAD